MDWPPSAAGQAAARGFGATDIVKSEKLTNLEVGVKGRFLDGKAALSTAIDYDKSREQIFAQPFLYPDRGTIQLGVEY